MKTNTLSKVRVRMDGKAVKELKKVVKGAKRDKELDVFNHVSVTADGNNIVVRFACDKGNTIIDRKFSAETAGTGTFLFPVGGLKQVKGVKNSDVYTFENENDTIKLDKNGASRTFNGCPNDFPAMKKEAYTKIGAIDYTDVVKLVAATVSTAKTETRPVLQNVLIRDGYVASTDSFRMYKTDIEVESERDLLLHFSGVKKLKDIFNKQDGEITVFIGEMYAKFESAGKAVYIQSDDGNYPQLDRLIPGTSKTSFSVTDLPVFMQVIDDAHQVTKKEKNNVIRMNIDKKGVLVIGATSDVGDVFEAEYVVDGFCGEALNIAFNGTYLLEALKQLEKDGASDKIVFGFNGNVRPFTIECDESMALILPVRMY